MRYDVVWQRADVVDRFVHETRAGVPYGSDQVDVMLRVLAAGRAVDRFLDLGCGSGVLAAALLDRYPLAQGTLIDFSEPMLKEARLNLADHAHRVRYQAADLSDSSWPHILGGTADFDAVVSGYAIHHLANARKVELYREILPLLRDGGQFVNVEHVASPTSWIESISDGLFVDSLFMSQPREPSKSHAQIADEFAGRPDKAANILASVEEQCRWLRDLGYTDVDCYFKVFELAVFGGRRAGGC